MSRSVKAVLACLSLILSMPMPYARATSTGESSARFQEYQTAIEKLILNRMQAIRYRTLTGGVAVLVIDLDRSGTVTRRDIHRTSGSPYIDRLALEAVPLGYGFPPIPDGLRIDRMEIKVPLRFGARP